ncbi:hypothetical protein ABPG74_019514 [Tetrahymena malaccensis]
MYIQCQKKQLLLQQYRVFQCFDNHLKIQLDIFLTFLNTSQNQQNFQVQLFSNFFLYKSQKRYQQINIKKMMHMNNQSNQEEEEDNKQFQDDAQDLESEYDNDQDDDGDYQDRNLSNELKEALFKSRIILKRAIFSYAYYRLSKMILNYFAKKLFNTDIEDFFYWNIFKFSEIVVKK